MEAESMEGQLRRASLGRVAFIGELYNARKESFSSRSLLKSSFPPSLIECQDTARMEFESTFTEGVSERLNLLKVEAELQVSVLLGLVEAGGSGSFLMEEEKSEKSVCCSLLCSITTVCEKFFAPLCEMTHHIDLTALEDPENTHIVTEVNWGTNCVLSLAKTSTSKADREELKGQLRVTMEKLKMLLSVKGAGALETTKSVSEFSRDLRIKVCADIVPDGGWPTSLESFCEFVISVPKLLQKVNNGKGKPLSYVMSSLNTFRRLAKLSSAADITVRSIDQSFLTSTVYLLEEVALLKRKLHDLLTEMTGMRKYVKEDDLKAARKHQQDLAVKESDLKLLISEQWVQVRSGNKNLSELIRQVESFKSRSLRLYVYDEYLDTTGEIQEKLDSISHLMSLGIVYLGKGDTFESVMLRNLSCEFFVLLVSSEVKEKDPELYTRTYYYFLTEASNPRLNTKYVIVDFDYQREQSFMNVSISTSRVFHLKGSNILSKDKFADYEAELLSNFVRAKNEANVVYTKYKPGNRVPVEILCPGFLTGTCSTDPVKWKCFRCKSSVEYGFDELFYCSCGEHRVDDMTYQCSHPSHGNVFLHPSSSKEGKDFIRRQLSSLKPLKEMNVLILGCSGVGKSTWINSIINYLTFGTLERAKEHGVICTIPVSFTAYDAKSSAKYHVNVGMHDENEANTTGQSATQFSHTYSFIWGGKRIRLIDTPGLGDTRGIQQDRINLKNIIQHISHLKELHAVCVLLKANENRINAIFSYCLKELLVNLHKNVKRNMVFCFTNARNSLYTPGQTAALLETLIRQLDLDQEFPLGEHNMFCLDNEAFIFLCSLTNPKISYDPILVESFGQSWNISVAETTRLFQTIKNLEPHELRETLSLVDVRNRIMSLAKPMAEITKTIEINISTIRRKQQEIKASDETLADLSKKFIFTEIHLEPMPLSHPRTVCTAPSCVEYLSLSDVDVKEVEYKTHCHARCYLENVELMTVNNAALRNCDVMDSSGKCMNCGCGWEKHMHITYTQKRVEKQMENKNIGNAILQEKSEKKKLESFINKLEVIVKKYKKEEALIIQASVKFGMFLRRNAITVYNNSIADYIEYLIEEEENKPHKSRTEENVLKSLKETLAYYHAEVALLTRIIKEGENNNEELTLEQILDLEQQLYSLELTGKDIMNSAKMNRHSKDRMMQYLETPIQISQKLGTNRKQSTAAEDISGLEQLKNWLRYKKT